MLVTLLPGATAERVLGVLDKCKREITNYHGDLDGYVEWARIYSEQLRGQISADDINILIKTLEFRELRKCLWTAPGQHPQAITRTNRWLDSEISQQSQLLTRAYETLIRECLRWRSSETAIAVVDTSVFLQHPYKLLDIDYGQLLELGDTPLRLVVPYVVICELDHLKRSGNNHVRWRAGHTLGVIDELLRAQSRRAIPASDGTPSRVTIEVFGNGSDRPSGRDNDREIMDQAVAVAAYSGRPVCLLTMDSRFRYECHKRGLLVVKPDRELGDEPAPPGTRQNRRRSAA